MRLSLQDVDIVGASVGVVAKVYSLTFGRVDIAGCSKGAIVKANRLNIGDSDLSDNGSFGLRASAVNPLIGGLSASRNAGDGAKVKHARSTTSSGSGGVSESSFHDNGKNGLVYVSRDRSRLDANDASGNGAAGIKVMAKEDGVWLEGNRADDNGTYGFYLRGNVPDEPSLTGAGNSAAGNATQDVFVQQF